MNYDLTEDQQILRESVRKFAENVIKPVARELDEKEEFSLDTMSRMAEMGLFGVFVSPEYQGQGLEYISYIIATEEIARIDGSHAATVAAGNSLGIGPINYFGNAEQKKKYLPKLCSGEALWGFGLTEPDAGSDAGGSRTTATLDGNEWVINGSKIFITNASTPISMGVTVQVVTGKRPDGRPEISCLLVENGTRGFESKEMHGKLMWRSSNTSELYFEDCRVPKENLLGQQGDGFHQMLSILDGGRLSIGAMGLGCAQGAFDLAIAYAQERQQFGKPICKFQAIAFKLADMAMEIELARNLLYKAGWLREQKRPFGKEAAMGKLYCSEVARRVATQAVQIHGGYGLMKEYDVERFYRDAKLLEIGEGTSEVQRIVISRQIGC
ncbi:MAG: acyl-CoA dehydrogenase family protein [Deltaproteobacteria bacterium]|nr:acyl-CoA dehydrogenase family protein [Deltaproteobacteria bacterium]MBW1873629.1 acyl-CoA dehydrogenase family protein [Deltaproteobacteria bacterium]